MSLHLALVMLRVETPCWLWANLKRSSSPMISRSLWYQKHLGAGFPSILHLNVTTEPTSKYMSLSF
ncbi:hypothetical protein BpHYR1_012126 [Brachionus plicatilis]|uniref:Uncharacterized protein n=1 Tax=Brachionus plicatilis TaxID=10195 RepID=A0A3M7T051_BRAPC|nr:hypothetical protein BpHYR1_012126 [Brachionus plicatilis]